MNRKLFAGVLILSVSTAVSIFVYQDYRAEQARMVAAKASQKVHGEGKKAVSCDMSRLLISYRGQQNSHDVNELISLDAEGRVQDSSKRIRRSKVMPMVELLREYPDATAVEFLSCDAAETTLVPVATLKNDPFNYLLSFNNRKRARVITYRMSGNQARYNTEVKNLYRMIIHTDG